MDEKLTRLPEITDHVLSGLRADEALKHRILLSAASQTSAVSQPSKGRISFRTVVALCCLSAVLVLLCVFALGSKPEGEIQVIPAGSHHASPPVGLEEMIEEASGLDD